MKLILDKIILLINSNICSSETKIIISTELQNIAFEMEDDPFEVKLRDNYAVCDIFSLFF